MSRKKKGSPSALAALSISVLGVTQATNAVAGPVDGSVVMGDAVISQDALQTIIEQTSKKAVINWKEFDIPANELVQFIQNAGNDSVTLNRVTSDKISSIQGALQANGNIFLINPNGILFGNSAQVDVAGLLATTLDVDNQAFMDGGQLDFAQVQDKGLASIVNQGRIETDTNGFIYLIAPRVDNQGHVIANIGRVTMAAGDRFSVDLSGNQLINFSVSAEALSAATGNETGVNNSGSVSAQHVLMSAKGTSGLMSSVVNNSGIIEATELDLAGAGIVQNGYVNAQTATLTATDSITTGAASHTRADTLNLEVTADGASIGQEGVALKVDAGVLNAKATNGHIIVTDVNGGVALGEVDTGITDATEQRRVIIRSENGSITSADSSKTNVKGWSANFEADGAIGSAGHAINTEVDVLTASTQNGGIFVDDQAGSLILGAITARESITVGGQATTATAISDGSGNITLSNGQAGTHDVAIRSREGMVVTAAVSATNNLTLQATEGDLVSAADAAVLTGRNIDLTAGGTVADSGRALKTQSNSVSVTANNGGVYLSENNGLAVGSIVAKGENNNVSVTADQGSIALGSIEAEGASVTLNSQNGGVTDANGDALNVAAKDLTIRSSAAIGTQANALETAVSTIDTATKTVGAGTFLANTGALQRVAADTKGGDVQVRFDGGALAFNRNTNGLSLTRQQALDLSFTNGAGGLRIDGINAGANNSVVLDAAGDVAQGSGATVAGNLKINASGNIGSADSALITDTRALTATSRQGLINVDNLSPEQLALDATANGTNGAVRVRQAGDLLVNSVVAKKDAVLTAGGAIDAGGNSTVNVNAAGMTLDGARIGSASNPMFTQVTGPVTLNSRSDINLQNTGEINQLQAQAAGNLNFRNAGNVAVNRIEAGESIQFDVSGNVTDANADGVNFIAKGLTASSTAFGEAGNGLEMQVESLVIDTRNGGIYARQLNGQPLALVRATASGSAGSIDIDTAGDMNLGVVNAGGNNVKLTAGGKIEDARTDKSVANVNARSLDIRAPGGIGNNGDLALDVSFLSAAGGEAGVKAANAGAIAVDSATLQGKGASQISIIATHITVLNNNGGVTTMDGGTLTLVATDGNIVFLNQNDTIYLPGGGSITLTAMSKSEMDGYSGVIVAGNLRTDGGDITLQARSNITIGMLDAGTTGNVTVASQEGMIIDGNGLAENIRGNHVRLTATTASRRDQEIARDTAIAEYSSKVAEAAAKLLQLETLQSELKSYEAQVVDATVARQLAATNEYLTRLQVRAAAASVEEAAAWVDVLNTALNAATLVRNAAAVIAGAAQAIPFSGDAGADAAFAIVDLAMSAAALALDSYERYDLAPRQDELDELNNLFDVAQSALTTAATNLNTWIALRDTTRTSRDMADLAVFKANVARDASQQIRKQAITAYDLNRSIDSSVDKPLGISANRLDVNAGGSVDTTLFLQSDSSLSLGNISAGIGQRIVAKALNNIGIVGNVVSDTSIDLTATHGGIFGQGGTLKTPDLSMTAGNGIHNVNTQVERIAAAGGLGGVSITNRNDGALLTVGSLNGVNGLSGNGFVSLDTDGDLLLTKGIRETSNHGTVSLTSGGAIQDGNDAERNVEGGRLIVNAAGNVELDTEIAELVATSNTGNLTVREASDLSVLHAQAAQGNIDISTAGRLVAGSLAANADKGRITLTTGGNVEDDQLNETVIAADQLVISAAGSVGAVGSDATRALDLQIASVKVSASGEVNLAERDDLNVELVDTDHGNVTITSATGSLKLGDVTTGTDVDTVTLIAAQGISNAREDAGNNVTAANLSMQAGNGIGGDRAVAVDVARLVAHGGIGGIAVVDNSGDLTIGGVTANLGNPVLTGLVAYGDIDVRTAQGTLNVNEAVTGQGNVALSAGAALNQNVSIEAGKSVTVKAGSDITMAAGTATTASEDVTYVAGGNLTSQAIDADGNVSLTATNGNALQNGNIEAGKAVAVNAGGDITMAAGTTTTAGENATYIADGNVTSAAVNALGDIRLTAGGNVQQNDTFTAGKSVAVNALGNIVMDPASATSAGEDVTYVAAGNLTSQAIDADGNVSLTATNGNALQNGNIDAGKSVAVNAGGDIVMHGGTQTVARQGVSYVAGNDIAVERIETEGNVTLTATGGAISASAQSENVQAKGLLATAANGIGQLASTLKTRVDNLVLRITGTGNVHVNEADSVLVAADSKQGDIILTAGGDIQAQSFVARQGDVNLNAAGRVFTGSEGQIGAKHLAVTAVNGVAVRTAADSATIAVTGAGDLQVDEADGILLERLTAVDGNVNVAAGGRIAVDTVAAGAGRDLNLSSAADIVASRSAQTPANALTGNRITLNAASGIGQSGALDTAANRLSLNSTAGDIRISQVGAVLLDSVTAGNGNVDIGVAQGDATLGSVSVNGNARLSAKDGMLKDDGNVATRIAARGLELDAANGIGAAGALQTKADSLVATVRGAGAIRIDELDGLDSLTASTVAGDVTVRSESGNIGVNTVDAAGYSVRLQANGGAIRDARNDARNNITADNLLLTAARGVGQPDNALDVTVSKLTADGGTGGVYINSLSTRLLQLVAAQPGGASLSATGGNIMLNAAGPLSVTDRVVNSGGGSITLRSSGDIAQNSDVRASGSGNVSFVSDASIVMGNDVTTATGNGTVSYSAGDSLAVSHVETGNTRGGGRVVFTAPKIIDNLPGVNNVKGWVVDIASPTADKALVTELVGETQDAALVRLDYRPVGGNLLDSRRFMDDLLQTAIVQKQNEASRALMDVGMLATGALRTDDGFVQSDEGTWEFNK